ncbi:MAG: hypothetical protein ACR2QW_16930, partial [bacterium]
PKHSLSLHKIAETRGASTKLVTYDGIGHIKLLLSLSKPFRGSTPALEDIVRFFEETESLEIPDV